MLGNCEKMVLISSPPSSNQWPQSYQVNDPKLGFNNMGSTSVERVVGMDQKVVPQDHEHHQTLSQQQQQQEQLKQPPPPQQEALRCPRCDSSNTKFCYYNNYSLSQPRHFCKACKRYWTRGGTLRNVPVGGGCRKNKRVKRPSSNNNTSNNINISSPSSTTSLTNNNNGTASFEGSVNSTSLDMMSCGQNHHHQSLFYGSEINFPFSRYDLPQMNGMGLGFSSSSGLVHNMNGMNIHNNNNSHPQNNNTKQIFQDLFSSNPLLSNYSTTTTTTTTTSPTISSLLASMKGSGRLNHNNFQTLLPSFEDDQGDGQSGNSGGGGGGGMFMKQVKMEFDGQNRSMDHHWNNSNSNNPSTTQTQMDQPMGTSSDPSSILWGNSGSNLGAWLDPSNNLGSSVPSLI